MQREDIEHRDRQARSTDLNPVQNMGNEGVDISSPGATQNPRALNHVGTRMGRPLGLSETS
jgi:hypothetical protein